ncbi:MAG TPA: ABC transporter transmembrane domain-containing protein [Solirubrobacteraceae bacterium]|nr:ABC transporter transmembrane domain-containing protein [Solirubrobacteraceae bacterium]
MADLGPDRAGHHGPRAPDPRDRADDPRPARRGGAGPRRRDRPTRRRLRLPRRGAGAARRRPRGAGRAHAGDRRAHRSREVHAAHAGQPALRRRPRQRRGRGHRRPRGAAERVAPRGGDRRPQSFLVYGTIRENITYGRPDASDAEVEAAAAAAQLPRTLDVMDAGLDTDVGEAGLALSGGQRERVAIARALLVEPRVLALDNATSNLDARTETALLAELRRSAPDRATLFVSDRPATIAAADEVAMLEGGVITARGAHRELLAENARYRRLASVADVDELQAQARGTEAPATAAPAPPRAPAAAHRSRHPAVPAPPAGSESQPRRAFAGVLALLRRQGVRPWAALAAVVVGTVASLVPPYLAGQAVNDVLERDSSARLDDLCIVLGLSVLVLGVATYAQTRVLGEVGQFFLRDLRERAFAHLQRLPISFFDRTRTGTLISRLANDMAALNALVLGGMALLLSSTLTIGGTFIVLFAIDAELALIVLAIIPSSPCSACCCNAARASRCAGRVRRRPSRSPCSRRRSPVSVPCAHSPRRSATGSGSTSSTSASATCSARGSARS